MDNLKHENDLDSLILVRPPGRDFSMYVTPRHRDPYEGQPCESFSADLLAGVLNRARLFVDVGAHCGFFTLLAAKRHPRLEILAFEPVPETAEALRRNVALHGLQNVTVHEMALPSDTTLDAVLAGRTPGPTVVKIDAAGHELAVLSGMAATLERFPDLSLLIEFNPERQRAAGRQPEELLRELDRLGFTIFLLDDRQGLPFRLKPETDWTGFVPLSGHANLYCVPKDRALSACFFSHSAGLAGAERSLLELVADLVCTEGVVCTVVVPADGPLVAALTQAGAACLVSSYGYWCDAPSAPPAPNVLEWLRPSLENLLCKILPVLARVDPDVIQTQTMGIPWGAVAAALLNKPHVWSVRESGKDSRFFVPFEKILQDIVNSSAFIYTCSDTVGAALFPELGATRRRTYYPHIRLPDATQDTKPSGCFVRNGAVRLGVFGTLQKSKGQEDAIRALAQLVERGRDVELLLAGQHNPDYRAELQALITAHGLADRVRIPGFLSDPFPAMRETDIVLSCSRDEAFGRTMVEGMLLGKPVIYTAAGGFLEYMVDGRTGLSYPPGDAAALAARIETLLDDPRRAADMAAAARAWATERFNRSTVGRDVFPTFQSLRRQPPGLVPMPATLQAMVCEVMLERLGTLDANAVALSQSVATHGQQRQELFKEARQKEEMAGQREQLEQQLQAANQALASLRQQNEWLEQVMESAQQWQRRSWFKRAFHRWRLPGTLRNKVGLLRRWERSLRKRRKRVSGWLAHKLSKPTNLAGASGTAGNGKPHIGSSPPMPASGVAAKPNQPPAFAIYFNTHGNYFFQEIALLLNVGMKRAGFAGQLRTERDGWAKGVDFHLVVAPHEFFFLGEGPRRIAESKRESLLLLNTEQSQTQWYRKAEDVFSSARHVFDMNPATLRSLKDSRCSASHLPLGFLEDFPLYDGSHLPVTPETEALGSHVFHWIDNDRPLAERPIDISFVGEANLRRSKFFAVLAPEIDKFECHLRLLPESSGPWRAEGFHNLLRTQVTAGISRRSRVVLNIHRADKPYFEWHRIVLMGLWQKALVISETVTDTPPFISGQDFVQMSMKEMPDALQYYLRDPRGIRDAEKIRESGHRKLREQCALPEILKRAWKPFLPFSKEKSLETDLHAATPHEHKNDLGRCRYEPGNIHGARIAFAEVPGLGPVNKMADDNLACQRTKRGSMATADFPIPPAHLRYRIVSTQHSEEEYLRIGLSLSSTLIEYWKEHRTGNPARILDFGCGCGRVLRHLLASPVFHGARFDGCDIDAPAIEWCRKNLPGNFHTSRRYPPLNYPDQAFDLIYGLSVFTHIDLDSQRSWMKELARVLSDDGILLLSVNGTGVWNYYQSTIKGNPGELGQKGFVFVKNIADGVLPKWYQTSFNSVENIRQEFGEHFDILQHASQGLGGFQDLLVLRRKKCNPVPAIAPPTATGSEVIREIAPGDGMSAGNRDR